MRRRCIIAKDGDAKHSVWRDESGRSRRWVAKLRFLLSNGCETWKTPASLQTYWLIDVWGVHIYSSKVYAWTNFCNPINNIYDFIDSNGKFVLYAFLVGWSKKSQMYGCQTMYRKRKQATTPDTSSTTHQELREILVFCSGV